MACDCPLEVRQALGEGGQPEVLEDRAQGGRAFVGSSPQRRRELLIEVPSPNERITGPARCRDPGDVLVENAAELLELPVGESAPIAPGTLPRQHRAGDGDRRPGQVDMGEDQALRTWVLGVTGVDRRQRQCGLDAGPTLGLEVLVDGAVLASVLEGDLDTGQARLVTVRDGAVAVSAALPGPGIDLAVAPGGGHLYVAHGHPVRAPGVATVDPATGDTVADVPLCDDGYTVGLTPAADGGAVLAGALCTDDRTSRDLAVLVG